MEIDPTQFDVHRLWATLAKDQTEITAIERRQAIHTATCLVNLWEEVGEDIHAPIIQMLEKLSSHPGAYNNLLIDSLRYQLTKDLNFLKTIPDHIDGHPDDLTACASSFMSLANIVFNDTESSETSVTSIIDRRVFRSLFEKKLKRVMELYDLFANNRSVPFSRNAKVVVLTRQFLAPPHAPTVDAINFAIALIEDFGKEVMIVASSEISKTRDGAIAPGYVANMVQDLAGGLRYIELHGHEIPFIMCGDGTFGDAAAKQGIVAIDAFTPEMILSVSAPSVIAEPFHNRSFCFIYPSERGVPLTNNCYFHTWDQPDDEMNQILAKDELGDLHLFTQHPGFDVKTLSNGLTRKQFGIPEDVFLFVVVGLRLSQDVDDSFLQLLGKICEHPKTHLAFAGIFDNYDEKVGQHPALRGRTTHLGFQMDIMGVYNISDAFLNPTRKGGGSGIIYAMQAGLPVLSLPSGDAGMAAAGFPKLANYDEMAHRAHELMTDEKVLKDYRAMAREEAPKFSDRKGLLNNIMKAFEDFAKRHEQP